MRKSSFLAILLMLAMPAICAAAEAVLQSLRIEGDASAVHIIQILKQEDVTFSRVFRRNVGESTWQVAGGTPGEVTGTTTYGDDLVLMLSDGSWMIFSSSSGRPLPAGATLLSMAGDKSRLFALGQPALPGTRPATTQATTQPAVFRPGTPLVLFELIKGSWSQLAELPVREWTLSAGLSLSDDGPSVILAGDGRVAAFQFSQSQWQALGERAAQGRFDRVISDAGQLLVFLSETKKPSQLLVRKSDWLEPIPLTAESQIRVLGVAGGQIRFIYAEAGQIKERLLSPRTLKVESADAVLQLNDPVNIQHVREWIHWAMMLVISLVMIHTYRKRDEYRKVTLDWNKVQLAPLGRRFFAGMIDLMPVIAALLYARASLPNVETLTALFTSQAALLKFVLPGTVLFLVHTTVVEAVAGRSIGKIVTQLQVVRLDGKRPALASLVIRNLLRAVDLVLWFTMALMVIMPLRQRIGDLAAGTVVVCDRQEDSLGPDA